jgi:hypothetical protein
MSNVAPVPLGYITLTLITCPPLPAHPTSDVLGRHGGKRSRKQRDAGRQLAPAGYSF